MDGKFEPERMIWIFRPKKASKVATDMTEDRVRTESMPLSRVETKVSAVDEV